MKARILRCAKCGTIGLHPKSDSLCPRCVKAGKAK